MDERLVLLRRGALGDVVLLGAVTASWPGPVTVVCEARWTQVAAALTGVDQVRPWGEPLPAGRGVDLQGGLRGWRAAPGAPRIRKRSLRRRVGLWTGLRLDRPTVPELYAEAVEVPVAPLPWIATEGTREALALVPGAAWATKRPQAEVLLEVGRRWQGPVVVLGGPGEEGVVRDLVQGIPGARGVTEHGFSRTLEALAGTRVAVCGDTGLMHLAGASGAAVVALFGPTHPRDGFFVYPGEVVQRMDLACRPCTLHRQPACPLGHLRCQQLDAERVWEAVQRCAG